MQVKKKKLLVVKIGGNVIDDPHSLSAFVHDVSKLMTRNDVRLVLVHGGGKVATRIGDLLHIQSKYENGRRITDDATIDLVTMVYGGLVNKQMVAKLQAVGVNALGLTGADANILPARKRPVKDIDFGWVGDVEPKDIGVTKLTKLLDADLVPVFAPLTHDQQGHMLNTNADTIASSLAVALSVAYEVRLIYCFEKKGVLENIADETSVVTLMNRQKYQQLLQDDKLFEGILPKLANAFAAIDAGVTEVLIGHATDLLQNTTEITTGTLITA